MKKKVAKLVLGLMAAGMLAAAAPQGTMEAMASTAAISFSDPDAGVGETFSVTVKVDSKDGTVGSSDIMLSYDPDALEFVSGSNASGGAGSVKLSGSTDSANATSITYTLKFKALKPGNAEIKVGDYEVYDADDQSVDVNHVGQSSVKVSTDQAGTEAALGSLQVSPGTLQPAFSADITEYTVNVSADTQKLAVTAVPKDAGAKVSVTGTDLTAGDTVTCLVTAADGATTKTYTIKTVTGENGTTADGVLLSNQTVTVDGVAYTLAQSFGQNLIPQNFEENSVDYEGTGLMGAKSGDMQLLYLVDESGAGHFFIYDKSADTFTRFATIDVSARSIVILKPDASVEIPAGFVETTITLNGDYEAAGWIPADGTQDYCLVYAMNAEGAKGLYSYDMKERTIQRYLGQGSGKSADDEAGITDQMNRLKMTMNRRTAAMIVLGFITVALLILLMALFFRRRLPGRTEHDADARDFRPDDLENEDTEDDLEFLDEDEPQEDKAAGNEQRDVPDGEDNSVQEGPEPGHDTGYADDQDMDMIDL